MTKEEVAKAYLSHLQEGNVDKILSLFTGDGIVISPLYGTKPAMDFYTTLIDDTNSSEITFDGLFYEEDNNRVSLLFDYVWTLRNHKKVSFKVVDVIALDPQNKIKELRIIYDTVSARAIFEEQKKRDNKE